MVIRYFLGIMLVSVVAFSNQNWRVEVALEQGLDVMKVYETLESKVPILVVEAEAPSQGFIGAEEIYMRSTKKKYLLTRWILGATGSESLKIYDVSAKSKKEVYKLQSMPSSYSIKGNRVIFEIPNPFGVPLKTEWIAN